VNQSIRVPGARHNRSTHVALWRPRGTPDSLFLFPTVETVGFLVLRPRRAGLEPSIRARPPHVPRLPKIIFPPLSIFPVPGDYRMNKPQRKAVLLARRT